MRRQLDREGDHKIPLASESDSSTHRQRIGVDDPASAWSTGRLFTLFLAFVLPLAFARQASAQGLTPKWQFPLGEGTHSSPALAADGTAYIGRGGASRGLVAVNPNGSAKWASQVVLGGDVVSSPVLHTYGGVTVALVGTTTPVAKLYAIDATSGAVRWTFPDSSGNAQPPSLVGVASTPVASGNKVYFTAENGNLYGVTLNAQNTGWTGFWSQPVGAQVAPTLCSSPVIGENGDIYVAGNASSELRAFSPAGSPKWAAPPALPGYVTGSPAIGYGGTLYINTWYTGSVGTMLAVNPWDGAVLWQFSGGSGFKLSPAVGSDGTIYTGCDDGSVYAINPDGTLKWKRTVSVSAVICSSPAIGSNGYLYIVDTLGTICRLALDNSTAPTTLSRGISSGFSSPTIAADGTVYFGTLSRSGSQSGDLVAVTASGTLSSTAFWPQFQRTKEHTAIRSSGPSLLPPGYGAVTLYDLGTLGGFYSTGQKVNYCLQVAGYSHIASQVLHPFVWRNGFMSDLSPAAGQDTYAYAINDRRMTVGSQTVGSVQSPRFWDSLGAQTTLNLPGGFTSGIATTLSSGLDNTGIWVAGYGLNASGVNRALRWTYLFGTAQNLGSFGSSLDATKGSYAYGMNNARTCVGEAQTTAGAFHGFVITTADTELNPAFHDIGTLSGVSTHNSSVRSINDRGVFVGYSQDSSGISKAFRRQGMAAGFENLGSLGGTTKASYAYGVNNLDQVVGTYLNSSGVSRPFAVVNNTMYDLGAYAAAPWDLQTAFDINDQGVVVGWGYKNGEARAFALVPAQ